MIGIIHRIMFEKENLSHMQGLITKERKNIDPAAAPFAKDLKDVEGLREGASPFEVVKSPWTQGRCFMIREKKHLLFTRSTLELYFFVRVIVADS